MKTWLLGLGVLVMGVACGESSSNDGSGGGGGSAAASGSGGSSGSAGSGGSAGSSGGSAGSGGAAGSSGGAGGSSGGAGGASGGAAGSGGAGGVDCNPSTVTCKKAIPVCPPGQVPAVENGCWGKCIGILECATEKDCSNCTTGFCAKYESFVTNYRCVMPSLQCSALACSCLAPYFCASPWDACNDSTSGPEKVSCSCPSC